MFVGFVGIAARNPIPRRLQAVCTRARVATDSMRVATDAARFATPSIRVAMELDRGKLRHYHNMLCYTTID